MLSSNASLCVIFNNRDDPAKNFSFRMGCDMRWQLSCTYDLTFSRGPNGHHESLVCGEA